MKIKSRKKGYNNNDEKSSKNDMKSEINAQKSDYLKRNPDVYDKAAKESKDKANYIQQKAEGFPNRPDLQKIANSKRSVIKLK